MAREGAPYNLVPGSARETRSGDECGRAGGRSNSPAMFVAAAFAAACLLPRLIDPGQTPGQDC